MRKILYIAILFMSLSSVACDSTEDDYYVDNQSKEGNQFGYVKQYMSLSPVDGGNAQGSARYDKYFFQGYNYNGQLSIYNLDDKRYLTTIRITDPLPNLMYHVNSIGFGNEKFSDVDFFPLLYICSGYDINGCSYIYAYRIQKKIIKDREEFSISLEQTISLSGFGGWTEGIVDAKNGYLWIKYSKNGLMCYGKYELPLLKDGDVTINNNDCLQEILLKKIPSNSSSQGHMFYDDNIYIVSGVPSRGQDLALISINTLTGEFDYIIDLKKLGMINPRNSKDNSFEPEGIIEYNGQMMICYKYFICSLDINEILNKGKYNFIF